MFWIVWILASIFTGPIGFIGWPIIYILGEFAPKKAHAE